MENEASKAVAVKKKGFLGVGILGVLAKGGALLFGHHGASAALHVAEEAAPAIVHAAPALTHDVASMAGQGISVAAHNSNLVEDTAKTLGRAATSPNTMSDAERIARNAAGVAKNYARQKARSAGKDERKEP